MKIMDDVYKGTPGSNFVSITIDYNSILFNKTIEDKRNYKEPPDTPKPHNCFNHSLHSFVHVWSSKLNLMWQNGYKEKCLYEPLGVIT